METIGCFGESGDLHCSASDLSLEPRGREILLIQRLLSKTTHPSPIKALFGVEELESAALAVSQYLASAAAAKKVNLGSPVQEQAAERNEQQVSNEHPSGAEGKMVLNR